jgi:thiamine transport system substrate-binding protein
MFFSNTTVHGKRALFTLVVSIILLGTLWSCGGGSSGRDEAGNPASEGAAASDANPAGGESGRLVIYTYDAFPEGLEELISAHMSEEYGVSVTMERLQDTGGLFNEVMLTRGEGAVDLVIGLDNTYIGKALEAGLFQPYRPSEADAVREDLLLDDSNRLIPFDYGNVVLNYDTEMLADPPQTWDELLDPSLRESIVLMNPATSSPGRNFLLLTIAEFGEEGYLDFWQDLEPNILTITSGWSEGYGLYSQGEAPIVLSYETSPAYHIAYEDTERYRNLILGGGGYAQIEVMGILSDAPNAENARRAVDFILSREFQSEIPLNQFMFPVRDDVTLPDAFTVLDRPERSVFMDVTEVDMNFEQWLEDWESVMR